MHEISRRGTTLKDVTFPKAEQVDPRLPTDAQPGSPEKKAILAARFAAGIPLWIRGDKYGR